MSINSEISEQINRIEAELKENRRYIHMHPELSFREYNTSSFIQKKLDEMGIKYVPGLPRTAFAHIYTAIKTLNPNQ